jgi:hypothetical protein
MNSLSTQTETALQNLAAVAADAQEMRLLKFVKGEYFSGDDNIPLGREFVAHVAQLAHGWVKFTDGKVVEQRVGVAADGFRPAQRDELGDTDQTKWETDATGKPRDPWCQQQYVPLENAETGELVTFVTASQGGKSAIGRLVTQFVRNCHNGLPVVRLATSSYKHKSFGRVEVPDFPIVRWIGSGSASSKPQLKVINGATDDVADEVPF